ncbi:MAG: metal-dependent hydrolase [Bryobacteraceae bacterium]|nr:metal-dependent hydrolase [Bryobacteraceae bacterium]MCX7604694.1 metal-dependent hydrolase [Bryobacteraceae bacterium]
MDNLTHSLTGVLLARTGLARRVPYGTALAVGAANFADIDIITGARSWICYLHHHRGFTHSLLWLPLVAAAPLPLWWLLARRRGPAGRAAWLRAYLVSLVASLTHPLLDLLNVYGVRIWTPASERWHHLDLLFIVDIWVWALLLVCVLGPMLARLVYSEIGARGAPGRGMAWLGLAGLAAIVGFRSMQHGRALAHLNARVYSGEAPRRVFATPTPANPWKWVGVVETRSFWRMVPVDLTHAADPVDPDAGPTFYKPDAARFLPIIAATETGRVFLNFSQAPCWSVTPAPEPEGATLVRISDLRFGPPAGNAFTATFLIDAAGRVLREEFSFGRMGPRKR